MRKMILVMILVLAMAFMAVPAFAGDDGWYIQNGGTTSYYYNSSPGAGWTKLNSGVSNPNPPVGSIGGSTATGGSATGGTATVGDVTGGGATIGPITNTANGGKGGKGGSAVIEKGAIKNKNTNLNSNTASSDADAKAKAKADALATAKVGDVVNEGNKVDINIEASKRAYLGAPSVGPAELNFGSGKVDWYFANTLPKIGIPLYQPNEEIKEVLDTTANVPIKKLLPIGLKMKKDQMPLGYNVRLIVVKAEAQKSWTSGGSVSGAGSYVGNAGSAGSASLVPSLGGTKAHDLYTLIIVKVE